MEIGPTIGSPDGKQNCETKIKINPEFLFTDGWTFSFWGRIFDVYGEYISCWRVFRRNKNMDIVKLYWFEIATGVVAIGLFTYILVLSRRLKAYKKMTTLLKGGNLEEHICQLEHTVQGQGKQISDINAKIKSLEADLEFYPHCWHLLRYNAFDKTGSDLSFSLALLNDKTDGFVLTSIFGREDSRLYAKPISGGKSEYTLSEEETQAIMAAMSKISR